MKKYAIIVAGGKGIRMKADIPKQFLMLQNKPVLMHTLETISNSGMVDHLVVVLPAEQIPRWRELCNDYRCTIPHEVVAGGAKRFFSVKNGLKQVPNDCLVAVHDGVRPFVAKAVIEETFRKAQEHGAAIPVLPVDESLRKLDKDGASTPVARQEYALVQTPQVFVSDLLKKAYQEDYIPKFTDDATVVENIGHRIWLTEGNRSNIKITTPFDLKVASLLV